MAGDRIIDEFPVYIGQRDLSLFYFPLSAPSPPQGFLDGDDNRIQLKPSSGHVQLQLGNRKFYGTSIGDLQTFQFVSTLKGGKLILHPVENIYSLRPLIPQQQSDAYSKKTSKVDAEEEGGEEADDSAKPVIMIRKKETETQTRERESSYVFLKKKIDEEPWVFMNLSEGDFNSLK
jgi:hypothetical protein